MANQPNYWQIACGSYGRDYADDFLRYGLAFVGGAAHRATMGTVRVGDRVIMKRGMTLIIAVGEVVERGGKHLGENDKEWLRDFDGWDLGAYCHVDWHVPPEPAEATGLTRTTIQNVHRQALKDQADDILRSDPARTQFDEEPAATEPVADDQMFEFLIRQGLRPGAADDLTTTLKRIRLLAHYYYTGGTDGKVPRGDVREHETRTFLVIPLLLALGWAEQQIKIEYPIKGHGRPDIACFRGPYTGNDEDCVLIIETKGLREGLSYAPDQAKGYASHFTNCRVVVVTNGYCYKAFERTADTDFAEQPSAYMNLMKPRDKYPLDPVNVDGCLEVLRILLSSMRA